MPAVRRTAQTDRNFGRVFYACRYGRDAGCGYFDWEDGGGNTLPPGSGGGLDMGRLQLLATLHARGALSDADYASAMALERSDVTAARQTWRWKPILGAKATFLAGSVQGAEVIPLESMEWTLVLEADV